MTATTMLQRGASELHAGFDAVARLLAITLGPTQGVVLNDVGRGSAESLDDSATIAKRITGLSSRGASAGAAIAGDLVRKVGARHGDGGATAVVIARALLRSATKAVAAGANPVRVRNGIRLGIDAACTSLEAQAGPVAGESALAGVAFAATSDAELAAVVGELVDILGADGAVEVDEQLSNGITSDYVDGASWSARLVDRQLLSGAFTELTLLAPLIALVDAELDQAAQVLAVLEAAVARSDRRPLLVIARDVQPSALPAFILNRRPGLATCAPVALATARTRMSDDFADLALLSGATVLNEELGCPIKSCRPGDLGEADRVVIMRDRLTIVGAPGSPVEISEQAARLRARATGTSDPDTRDRLWLRQARLLGRVGLLHVGAATSEQQQARRANARKAIRLAQAALADGTVPGGGVAYLACCERVASLRADRAGSDEALGLAAVIAGLEAPFLQLVANQGLVEPRVALDQVRALGPGYGLDTSANRYAVMREAGVQDVTGVLTGALRGAGETAGVLVSAEVVGGRG